VLDWNSSSCSSSSGSSCSLACFTTRPACVRLLPAARFDAAGRRQLDDNNGQLTAASFTVIPAISCPHICWRRHRLNFIAVWFVGCTVCSLILLFFFAHRIVRKSQLFLLSFFFNHCNPCVWFAVFVLIHWLFQWSR